MIIVLVGRMGSGKSKLGRALAKKLKIKHFEISTLVKSLLGSKNRSSLVRDSLHKKDEDPLWLAEPLRKALSKRKHWVVSGVRELALLDTIRDLGEKVYVVELFCPDYTRLKRCKDKYKTMSQLRKADDIDNNLGLWDVLNQADTTISTDQTFKQTFDNLIQELQLLRSQDT